MLNALGAWLGDPARAELRRAFEVMIERVLRPEVEPTGAPPTLEETRTMLETNMARWEREWQERSKAAGEIEGRRASILRILERRFGTIDETVRNRLAEATLNDLDIYLDRVVDAPDVDSIFAS